MSSHSYAVFGLGAFGTKMALELSAAGHTVLICDTDRSKVDELSDKVADARICDVSNGDVIDELNVGKFDAVILGMSSCLEQQMLALTLLKEKGARRILAKAVSDIQERILNRLGADEIIRPDKDAASRLAQRLSFENIRDIFDFKGSAIAEVMVPSTIAGHTLRELDLRNKNHITVLLLRKPESAEEQLPPADAIIEAGDMLTVFGSREDILKLFKKEG